MGWDLLDIPNQDGRTFVVTGANSGLGFQTALGLAMNGAHVVLAVRNLEKGRDAERRIRETHDGASLEVLELDLADLDSVAAAAARLWELTEQLLGRPLLG